MKATIMKNTPLSAFNNFDDISLPSGINSITRRILKMRSDLKTVKPAKISKSSTNKTPILGIAKRTE